MRSIAIDNFDTAASGDDAEVCYRNDWPQQSLLRDYRCGPSGNHAVMDRGQWIHVCNIRQPESESMHAGPCGRA